MVRMLTSHLTEVLSRLGGQGWLLCYNRAASPLRLRQVPDPCQPQKRGERHDRQQNHDRHAGIILVLTAHGRMPPCGAGKHIGGDGTRLSLFEIGGQDEEI